MRTRKNRIEREDKDMNRDFLKELGLEGEVIDKIMAQNGVDIEKAKGSLKDIESERDALKTQISERDKQLDALKKSSGDAEALKKQIEALQADNQKIKLDSAIDRALTLCKAKNTKAVRALLDLENAEFADDGTIKGLDAQIKALQKENDYLFDVEKKEEAPKMTGVTPSEGADGKPKKITKEEFARMGYSEREKLYEDDKELYDSLKD